jgi:putative ABC transport system permease protein
MTNPLPTTRYSLRLLRRDWRAGELRVLFFAVAVAVASVTSVGFFTDRVQQTLRRQANELLAADLVVSADHPLPASLADAARARGLRTVDVVQFRSMALAGDNSQLAEIKAVGAGYPLLGQLKLYDGAAEAVATGVPPRGQVWVEADLLRRLRIDAGAAVTLGAVDFAATQTIAHEPDRGGNLFNIAPRVLMRLDDVGATQLLREGSRAQFQLLVAGEPGAVAAYRKAVEPGLQRGERIVDVTDARQEVREALERSQRFLHLAALVSVLLAGVAVAMAARRHVERHLDNCAIMRCVGARQSFITGAYVLEVFWLGVLAGAAGCVLGYGAHAVLVDILGSLLTERLPLPGIFPVISGLLTGLVTLLAFALPPLLHLRSVPTLRVLRRDLGALPAPAFSAYALGSGAMAALLLWQAGELRLGLYVVGGVVATIAILLLMSFALVRSLAWLRRGAGVAWRFGLMNVVRRARGSMVQVLAFGVGMMALLLLTVVRGDLLGAWQGRLPPDAPNRFVINIQPDQLTALAEFFQQRGIAAPDVHPMVRGRLVAINGREVVPAAFEDDHARRLAEREFNLSWARRLQSEDNTIMAGSWWNSGDEGKPLLSVEAGIAQTLGLSLGDELTYDVAGERFSARIASLRKVQWDSFRANFFVLAPPGLLDRYPASYIMSFYLPGGQQSLLNDLVREFPNFTLIDVSAIMNKVRDIIARVTQAVQYVFLFTLLAGLLVLYAAIAATRDERLRESAVLRTLGASRAQLVSGVASEFATLGVLAGTVAALAATLIGYVLAQRVLHVPYTFNALLWLYGVVGGAVGVGVAGYMGTRRMLDRPPLQTLRGEG